MTVASPSGPTKIYGKALILLDSTAPCGAVSGDIEINALHGEVPHGALRCERSHPRPSYWNLAKRALFTALANPVSPINPGSRWFTEPGNASYGGL